MDTTSKYVGEIETSDQKEVLIVGVQRMTGGRK